jgi:signal transduction histidine kinase
MQELTSMLESQRTRLAEMVELAPFSILVLRGPRLLVEAYNPRYAPQVEASTVEDRPLEDVFEYFWQIEDGVPLVRLAQEVYRQNVTRMTGEIPTRVLKEHEPIKQHFAYTLIPSHDAAGQVSGVIIYAVNETERLAREAEKERELLRLIVENTDVTALALYSSQTAELIMGSPRYLEIVAHVQQEAARGAMNFAPTAWHDLSFFASSEEMDELWTTVMESHEPLRRSDVHIRLAADEPETIWNWMLTPIRQKENPEVVQYVLVTAVEITEAARARQEMEQLNRLKDDFLAFASHELRTPLTAIQGNAQLLQRKLQRKMKASSDGAVQHTDGKQVGEEQEMQTLERITHEANRLAHLVEEMVDITRIRGKVLELKDRENVNIVEVTRRVAENFAVTDKHVITVETSTEAISGSWDEARIEQVVKNLLSNAIKYSPVGTSIAVEIERQPDEVVLRVKDQGEGMGKEDQEHIFERFYRVHRDEQTRVDGLGLGLYIAHELVTQYGGRMWVESTPGEGSSFYVALPIVKTDR